MALRPSSPPDSFSHSAFDDVLKTHVDDRGQVDYAGLMAAPEKLETYYASIAAYSPDSHPELFPS
ncbi:MAG: hypothetical protein AAF492_00475, partial [Verrucomicrobiota bacterium]